MKLLIILMAIVMFSHLSEAQEVGDYTRVGPTAYRADPNLKDLMQDGVDQVIDLGISNGELPNSNFSVIRVILVEKQVVFGFNYRYTVEIGDGTITRTTTFVMYYRESTSTTVLTFYKINVPEEPAAEETTPPAEGTTPPTEETTPPAEGTIPPTEETTPPAEGTTPPAEETTPPAEGTTPPAEGTTPPTEETTPPAEGTIPPTEETTPPAEGTTPPVEGTTPPTEETTPPADATAQPPAGDVTPPADTTKQYPPNVTPPAV